MPQRFRAPRGDVPDAARTPAGVVHDSALDRSPLSPPGMAGYHVTGSAVIGCEMCSVL